MCKTVLLLLLGSLSLSLFFKRDMTKVLSVVSLTSFSP